MSSRLTMLTKRVQAQLGLQSRPVSEKKNAFIIVTAIQRKAQRRK
jgi:hypothetical protein